MNGRIDHVGIHETGILQKILCSRILGQNLLVRTLIVLAASENYTNT